jgi:hypothetical protein
MSYLVLVEFSSPCKRRVGPYLVKFNEGEGFGRLDMELLF